MRFVALLCLCAAVVASADQLELKNGDRITGKVVKKDGDKVTLKSEFFGEVTAPWSAVTSLTIDEPVTVVLPEGKTATGTVRLSQDQVEIKTPSGEERAAAAAIANIRNADEQRAWERLQNPGVLQLWTGYVDFGLALARGNARTNTMTSAVAATRITPKDKTAIQFNQIYATARLRNDVAATAQAVRGGWLHNKNISDRVFINVFNDYEYDRFQSLDLRFVLGSGVGYIVRKTERLRLDVAAGGAYNREKFYTLTRDAAEAYWGDDLTYGLSSSTSIRQGFRMFHRLAEGGGYRINFDVGAVTAINKWLGIQITASDRFLSNPVIGRQRNDILLSTGFRVSFTR